VEDKSAYYEEAVLFIMSYEAAPISDDDHEVASENVTVRSGDNSTTYL